MLTIKSGKIVFDRDRCCQCGVCIPSCPTDALSDQENGKGFLDIVCNDEACILCNICVKVCPPHWLPNDRSTEEQVRKAPGLYLAHARDPKVRWMSSSGGVARTIIREILALGVVDAAYSLLYAEPNPPTPNPINPDHKAPRVLPTGGKVRGRWLMDPVALNRIPCSIYRPVLWGEGLRKGSRSWRQVLVIGLPCHIKGAEKLLKKLLPRTKVLRVALLCRKAKVLGHTDCIKRSVGQSTASPEMVYYRGAGWPGKSGVYSRGQAIDTDYFYHNKCFTLPACHTCSDCLCAANADLTLADPWGIVREKDDSSGTNLVFAWTHQGKELLHKMDHAIEAEHCSADKVVRSVDFPRIEAKVGAMRYYLKQEPSLTRRLRASFGAFLQGLAELQLRLMHPKSFPIRAQLAVSNFLWRVFKHGRKP